MEGDQRSCDWSRDLGHCPDWRLKRMTFFIFFFPHFIIYIHIYIFPAPSATEDGHTSERTRQVRATTNNKDATWSTATVGRAWPRGQVSCQGDRRVKQGLTGSLGAHEKWTNDRDTIESHRSMPIAQHHAHQNQQSTIQRHCATSVSIPPAFVILLALFLSFVSSVPSSHPITAHGSGQAGVLKSCILWCISWARVESAFKGAALKNKPTNTVGHREWNDNVCKIIISVSLSLCSQSYENTQLLECFDSVHLQSLEMFYNSHK